MQALELVPAEDLIADPVALAQAIEPLGAPHPRIPLPRTLYGGGRVNSMGFDLSDERELASLSSELLQNAGCDWLAKPLLGHERRGESERIEVRNPADRRDVVGHVIEATRLPEQPSLSRQACLPMLLENQKSNCADPWRALSPSMAVIQGPPCETLPR